MLIHRGWWQIHVGDGVSLLKLMDLLLNLGWVVLDSGDFFFSNLACEGQVLFLHAWRVRCVCDRSAMGCETAYALGHGSCIDGDFDTEV